jgi:hypothetical protein
MRPLLPLLALGLLAAGPAADPAAAQCPTPPQYTNVTTASAGDLHFVMGTDLAIYGLGDPVQFYLSVYNSGAASVSIPNSFSITPNHFWDVLPDTCLNFYEPEGCENDSPFSYPEGVFFFGVPTSVMPGQCRTYSVTWDGVHWRSILGRNVVPGLYRVPGGFALYPGDVTSQGAVIPPLEVEILIADPVPSRASTWSRIKTRLE